jgi:hypothetical protein
MGWNKKQTIYLSIYLSSSAVGPSELNWEINYKSHKSGFLGFCCTILAPGAMALWGGVAGAVFTPSILFLVVAGTEKDNF